MEKELFNYIDSNKANIEATWKTLHSMPEPAFQEEKTSAYLADELRKNHFRVIDGLAGTGVLGILEGSKPGSVVGLRADMDALIHADEEGKAVAVHSCGHDANCTKVLWAARAIAEALPSFSGKLFVLFQPAEESLGGARKIIETGAVHELQYLLATHLRSGNELPLGKVTPSLLHSASKAIEFFVAGENAHGARPHQGINAIEAAVGIIQAIQALHLDPMIPHSAKVTKIQSGPNPFNVIPDMVSMGFDLRAQTNELMALQEEQITRIAVETGKVYGAKVRSKSHNGAPAAVRCQELVDVVAEAIKDVLGEQALAPVSPTAGGEDFHEYAAAIPNLKSTIIGIGADVNPGLHKADMTFHLRALSDGAKILASTAIRLLR